MRDMISSDLAFPRGEEQLRDVRVPSSEVHFSVSTTSEDGDQTPASWTGQRPLPTGGPSSI